jgi:MFS family permease
LGGFAVAGILGAFGSENWRYVFLTLPLLTIPVLALYWYISNPRFYSGFVEETREASALTVPEVADHTTEPAPPGALGRTLRNSNVVITAICSGLGLAIYTGLNFWLPLYLGFVAKYDFAAVAAYAVIFTITGGIGQILWGGVSDKLGRKYTLIICFVWLAIGMFLLQYTAISLGWLIVVQLFVGLATNGIYPVLYAFSSDSSERGAIAIGNGLQMVGQGIGGLSPLVIGGLIALGGGFNSATGYNYALYFMSALVLLAAVLIALFTRETIGVFKDRDRALVSRSTATAE